MKEFNTTAVCVPSRNYMVDISDKVAEIRKLVDAGKYFTISRARQYGKTTTLLALSRALQGEYVVLSLSFEGITKGGFETEGKFIQTFARLVLDQAEFYDVPIPDATAEALGSLDAQDPEKLTMDMLFRTFRRWFVRSPMPVVLLIDEVDSATNNQVFLDFLALLRDGYIAREAYNTPAFHTVILAGVTDVKHLKTKIRQDADARVNSPWNIAADFNVDMSLSEAGIRGMLEEYEGDHRTGMDTGRMAKLLREYTNGYPFLVSRLCQLIDTEVSKKYENPANAWIREGFEAAVRLLLAESNTLFQSLTGKLNNFPRLRASLRSILMEGESLAWNLDKPEIAQMNMYGFICNHNNTVRIANRIFETRLYNLFLSDDELRSNAFCREGDLQRNIFVENGKLNVRLIMEHFIRTYHEVFGPLEERFREKDGRELFLLYIKPIINGTGNYYIEAETRDQRRTDVIIDYLGQQYIIELKIWHGERYNARGEQQISDYLDYFGLSNGYMLSFNFNKNKQTGVKMVRIGDKTLCEGTV